jgi:hypothetical protein
MAFHLGKNTLGGSCGFLGNRSAGVENPRPSLAKGARP